MRSPIFLTRDPEEYAAEFKQRLLDLGKSNGNGKLIESTVVSEEYAEAARLDVLARARRVSGSFEANMIMCGRGA